jgi:acyl dehydratase
MHHDVLARNTATESTNRIHADETARQYGFRGGLVPGVDVYAYLAHLPTDAWQLDWLERGTMSARFLQPVYDGDQVTVSSTGDQRSTTELGLEVRNPAGERCATATATLPVEAVTPPPATAVASAPLPESRPPASPETLAPSLVLGSIAAGFDAGRAAEYLDEVGETAPIFRDEGIAHPGWLLRFANSVLVANVTLGPWIHVGSEAHHFAAVRHGDRVEARAAVTDEYERKGHRFVELDVLLVVQDDEPVARIAHTAIYEPRRTSSPSELA